MSDETSTGPTSAATDSSTPGPASERDTPLVRISLRTKLGFIAAACSVIPLVLIAWFLIDVNAETVEIANRELQIAVAQDLARSAEQSLVEAEDALVATGAALVNTQLDPDDRIGVALSLVSASSSLDHLAIYDADGKLIDNILSDGISRAPTPSQLDEGVMGEAAEDRQLAVGDVVADGEEVRVLVVVPLRAGGTLTGYVASAIDLAPIRARVAFLAETHFQDMPQALSLVDEQLRYLASSDPNRAALSQAPADGLLLGVEPASLETRYSRSSEYALTDGTAWVGTLTRLESRPWLIAVQVPRDVAYASLSTMRKIVVRTITGTLALALIAGLWAASRVTRPLHRLSELAHRLGRRDFSQHVDVSSNDELALLGHAMNTAATQLHDSEVQLAKEAAIRSDLGRYLPAEIVNKVVAREQDMALGGQRVEITVLFADVVAFTPLTEKLDAHQVVEILNELFTITTEIIFRHGGTVDKFVGDCVMAIWGAPEPQADHAARALAAAEEILSWLELGNAAWEARYGVTVQLAMGVNSGEAIVGNIGSQVRMEYTAIGDTVNVAARLESIARPSQILLTARTRELAGSDFNFASMGTRSLSGRTGEVELWELRA